MRLHCYADYGLKGASFRLKVAKRSDRWLSENMVLFCISLLPFHRDPIHCGVEHDMRSEKSEVIRACHYFRITLSRWHCASSKQHNLGVLKRHIVIRRPLQSTFRTTRDCLFFSPGVEALSLIGKKEKKEGGQEAMQCIVEKAAHR